jgi:uncharacterized protein (TIGR00369 family)
MSMPGKLGSAFEPVNPDFTSVIRESFARQGLMTTLGASLTLIAPGQVHIGMPFAAHLTQQNGYIHAGAITSIADNACGYATLSLLPAGWDILAAEFKINLLAPARAPRFEARARIIRSGRTLTIAQADVFGITEDVDELVATMLQSVFIKRAAR